MPQSLVAKPKSIFKGVVVATAGDVGNKSWDDKTFDKYMKNYGGQFSAEFDNSVTHLVATSKQFKNNVKRVKEARKRRDVEIVSLDWVELSMHKNKKLSTKEYSLRQKQKDANAKKRRSESRAKGIEQADKFVNPNLFHIYTDESVFRYEITIGRGDKGERYVATLFESNAEPRLYHTAAKYYKSKNVSPAFWRPSVSPGSFEREFDNFKYLFSKKTGVKWDARMEAAEAGKGKVGKMGKFQYTVPTGGKPVGLVNGEVWISPISGSGNVHVERQDTQYESTSHSATNGQAGCHIEEQVLTQIGGFLNAEKVISYDSQKGDLANTKAPATPKKSGAFKRPSLAKKATAARKQLTDNGKGKGPAKPDFESGAVSGTSSAMKQVEVAPKPATSRRKPASSKPALTEEVTDDLYTEDEGSEHAMSQDAGDEGQQSGIQPVADKAATIQDMVNMQVDEACEVSEGADDDEGCDSDDSGYGTI